MHSTFHLATSLIGCLLALGPALHRSTARGDRWPHVAMALGMAAGHLGAGTPSSTVGAVILLGAGWACGSVRRRALNGGHAVDFVLMAVLLALTAVGAHRPPVSGTVAHAHPVGVLVPLSVLLATAWTISRLAAAVRGPRTGRRSGVPCGTHLCAAGMAGSMALMAVAH